VTQQALPGIEPSRLGEKDFWPTPEIVTLRLLDRCPPPQDSIILEPAAGDGAIVRVLVDQGWQVVASDIRNTARECHEAGADSFTLRDWLADPFCDNMPVITNIPFSIAPEFIAATMTARAPYTALLMPIEELAGKQSTAKILKRYPPTDLVPLPCRVWTRVRGVSWVIWREDKPPAPIYW